MSTIGLGPLGRSGLFRCRRTAGVTVAAAAITISGLGAVPAATSAPDESCPTAYPVGQLAKGEQVHGLTVSSGTTPESFTGQVLGVVQDGIAPDLDMIMVRLTSPEIDRVHGIWSGMSGSPVYAEDGRLIGAVSYGLSIGPSPVAGVTPAADMEDLLSSAPADARARRALRTAGEHDDVTVPRSMRREMVSSGAVGAREANGGMSRLPLPLGISGMSTDKRLNYAAKRLGVDDVRVYKAGAVAADAPSTPIVAGGNLAASVSYGDVSSIGVGTATAVCGNEVLAFGHPMNFSGPSKMTMHGADAIYIQDDSASAPFKMANATAPVGGITQDRMAGLVGRLGDAAIPPAVQVTSHVSVAGGKSRDGRTDVSVPGSLPDIAAFHMLANEDRIFDGVGSGSSLVSWTVSGTRSQGKKFSYTRTDRYADRYDASFGPTMDLYDQLVQLQDNRLEHVRISTIHQNVAMSRAFSTYTVRKAEVRSYGKWGKLQPNRTLRVRAGVMRAFRVTLNSPQLPTRVVYLKVRIPKAAAGKFGYLEILGGNDYYPVDGEDSAPSAKTLPQLLNQLSHAPRNNDVLANLSFFKNNGTTIYRSVRKHTAAVAGGGLTVDVRGLRAKRGR